jgi:hypothetical protein
MFPFSKFSSKGANVLTTTILVLFVIEELELGPKRVGLPCVTRAYKFHDNESLFIVESYFKISKFILIKP